MRACATAYATKLTLLLSEATLAGFGLEPIMDVTRGGYWHFGFRMQVDVSAIPTQGQEAAYPGGMWNIMSNGGSSVDDRADRPSIFTGEGHIRGGFQHYATCSPMGRRAGCRRPRHCQFSSGRAVYPRSRCWPVCGSSRPTCRPASFRTAQAPSERTTLRGRRSVDQILHRRRLIGRAGSPTKIFTPSRSICEISACHSSRALARGTPAR